MRLLLLFFVLATLTVGTILTGCQSRTQKIDNDLVNEANFRQDLKTGFDEASDELKQAAYIHDWTIFKKKSVFKTRYIEICIAELKVKIQESGKQSDPLYAKKIFTLENKNIDLKKRMVMYEINKSDWLSFKREFNHDMDVIDQELKDLTVDNKK